MRTRTQNNSWLLLLGVVFTHPAHRLSNKNMTSRESFERKEKKKKRVTEKRERREWILVGLHELSSRSWWGRRISLTILATLPVCMSLLCRPPSPRRIIDMTKLALWLFGVCRLQWHSMLCSVYTVLNSVYYYKRKATQRAFIQYVYSFQYCREWWWRWRWFSKLYTSNINRVCQPCPYWVRLVLVPMARVSDIRTVASSCCIVWTTGQKLNESIAYSQNNYWEYENE